MRGKGRLGEGAGTAREGGDGGREGERAREGGGRGAGVAGPSAGKGRRAGRDPREEPAGRVTWGRYKRPKLKWEEGPVGLEASSSGLLLAFLTRLCRPETRERRWCVPITQLGRLRAGARAGWCQCGPEIRRPGGI